MKPWLAQDQKHRVAVVSAVRTPFAKAGTKLKDTTAVHLGTTVATEAIARAGIASGDLDEVVFGNAGTPFNAANIGRVIALRAGVPETVPGYTVHRNCASAMEAIAQGCLKIGTGQADTMLVGGTESMSNMPLAFNENMTEFFAKLARARTPQAKLGVVTEFRPTHLKPVVAIMEGLTDPISGLNMGQTAEVLARDFGISRHTQDEYAMRSHHRTVAAQKEGKFDSEIVPIVLQPKYTEALSQDVGPRENQTMEALGKLKPYFDKVTGTVTPGNACPITDGASALVLMNEQKARAEGREILGVIEGWAFSGCEPQRMGMGPIYSSSQLLGGLNLPFSEVDVVELNEAFAAQVLANQMAWSSKKYAEEKLGRKEPLGELSDEILNVNGGAIALGHPVGATGARLVTTILYEMKRKNLKRGLATLCIGGGQGGAFLLERH